MGKPELDSSQPTKTGHFQKWANGLRIRHIAHSRAASHYRFWDRLIGLLSTLLSAVIATTIFASLNDSDNQTQIIVAGSISILSTVVSGAYSFLKMAQLAERHHQAAASFGQLRREVEIILNHDPKKLNEEKLHEINKLWSELEKKVPEVPQRIFNIAMNKVVGKAGK